MKANVCVAASRGSDSSSLMWSCFIIAPKGKDEFGKVLEVGPNTLHHPPLVLAAGGVVGQVELVSLPPRFFGDGVVQAAAVAAEQEPTFDLLQQTEQVGVLILAHLVGILASRRP